MYFCNYQLTFLYSEQHHSIHTSSIHLREWHNHKMYNQNGYDKPGETTVTYGTISKAFH